ncbi:hypothetical protein EGT74_08500 [Chitinophaga lutea]|uniref:Uncharacterized protein n=1 Tax=Chitinophaga lutea TaxID=2488634 RepID=A0A3N4QC43_9BACT|nr:hypothetical protein [Chitinophaga lutea]RPE13540.1 hypothetical protein EGT74_08500 [Chitinophaga lutea]
MKKLFLACAAIALLAGPAVAQEKAAADKQAKKETCNKGADASCCKEAQTAKNKSCCVSMPSKAAALKTAAAAKKPAKPAPKG